MAGAPICECGFTKDGKRSNWVTFQEDGHLVAACVGCGKERNVPCRYCGGKCSGRELNHANQLRLVCDGCGAAFGPVMHRRKKRPQRARYVQAQHLGIVKSSVMDKPTATCSQCGSQCGLEVDHVKALGKGGANSISNVQALCKACHNKKTASEFGWWRS